MAIRDEGVTLPESTGAVETPTDPVTTTQTPGHPVSVDAVMPVSGPVTTEFGDFGQNATGVVETPGPVTIRNPAVKVVRAPRRQEPQAQTQADAPGRSHRADTGQVPRQPAPQPDYDGR